MLVLVGRCEAALGTVQMRDADIQVLREALSGIIERSEIDLPTLLGVVDSLDRPHPTHAEQAARSAASAVYSTAKAYKSPSFGPWLCRHAWSALCSCARTAAFLSTDKPWSATENQGWISERKLQLSDLRGEPAKSIDVRYLRHENKIEIAAGGMWVLFDLWAALQIARQLRGALCEAGWDD